MFVTSVFYSYSWLARVEDPHVYQNVYIIPAPSKKPHTICILLNIIHFPIADFQKKKVQRIISNARLHC